MTVIAPSASSTASTRPRIALTLGDPAGVGPELAARLLADPANLHAAEILILADRSELDAAAAVIGVEIPLSDDRRPGFATLLDDGSAPVDPIPPRQVSQEAGARALHQLRRAIDLANAGEIEAIVFTPLNKTSLHLGGMTEEDELRWFAKELHHDGVTSEINIIPGMWTARVTSHIGIREVADRVTTQGVVDAVQLLHGLLHDSGIESPRIGVCALNPHNGENGIFGREEIDVIRPGVDAAAALGIQVDGPWPSDTIFIGSKERYDGIVTMYHDQGQIAIKLMGFDGGVTVQGGLPVVIATPAHGTAFDIAGTGKASVTSSQNALDVAIAIAGRRVARAL
ncbi:4-hydroxy-L-threonine phosphate dehydrogenase PdxA [Clavibacter sp. B3I6]|uniref:4-hydroxythreonine-4-phosphate dehydrogenase PdxA n=1 Tax=Clavibacter sp. B3I6 TaxID=3042268 RepID=UPI0027819D5D|nr:4-hydroxythreonine-4-phosphate dehydrogenase PdxA [Clavibacter sp. B3I6]MDQ0744140.1 4-hydroxy-L-threonine phosphate dehydrogenase PdxA [Clavibacter sp. B3I6]